MYLQTLGNVFVQIEKYICPNWEIYLSKLWNIFVQIEKMIMSFLLCNFSSSTFNLGLSIAILSSCRTLKQTHLGSVGCVLYPQRLTKFRLSSTEKWKSLKFWNFLYSRLILFVISSFAVPSDLVQHCQRSRSFPFI